MTGKLTIVPTPVGNLDDITLRAIKTLNEVDLILCEDTRHSAKLLNHLAIKKPLKAFHQHNEHQLLKGVVEDLLSGKQIALISDAGTPGISDPGFLIVRACHENNIALSCLPGPTALIPAIVASALPCNNFYFEGFLPPKKGRQTRLKFLATLDCTVAIYESPYRILKTLTQLSEHIPLSTAVVVGREISKIHEEFIRGSLEELLEKFKDHSTKGEHVIMFNTKTIFEVN